MKSIVRGGDCRFRRFKMISIAVPVMNNSRIALHAGLRITRGVGCGAHHGLRIRDRVAISVSKYVSLWRRVVAELAAFSA